MVYKEDFFIEKNLPDPLSKSELIQCIKLTRDGSESARNKLIVHNIKLIVHLIKTKFHTVSYDKKELVSVGMIGLIKAVDTYDIEKNIPFSSYASICINNEILMFLRKHNRISQDVSLDDVVYTNKDGSEIKVSDTITDDIEDFSEKLYNEELILALREQMDLLTEREQRILKLYFGFYDDKKFSQNEIAEIIGLSRPYVSKIINGAINEIKSALLDENLIIELPKDKLGSVKKLKEGDDIVMSRKNIQSIYVYLKEYSKETIDEVIGNLTDEEKNLIELRYGKNLESPHTSESWTQENAKKFYGSLLPKIKRLLKAKTGPKEGTKTRKKKREATEFIETVSPREEKVIEDPLTDIESSDSNDIKAVISPNDYLRTLELLKTPQFSQILGTLSVKEAIIIYLRLGYVDGKYFSTDAIANFFNISENEVRKITEKVLLMYKETINNFIDNAINMMNQNEMILKLIKSE